MMDDLLKIHIDTDKHCFILYGNAEEIRSNRQLHFALMDMGYQKDNSDTIAIPYEPETQIKVLEKLQGLLEFFDFSSILSNQAENEVKSFSREQEKFEEFSKKAKCIRDNEFEEMSELVADFYEFQKILRSKMNRQLYRLQLLSSYHLAFAQNACNFSVPGAGKTSIVYGAYTYLKNLSATNDKHVDKLLIIGPLSSFSPWESEYKECFGKDPDVQRMSGNNDISRFVKEQHLYSGKPAEITLMHYESVKKFQEAIIHFLKTNKTMVVVDEAHRIKNPDGVWGESVVEIAKEARARVVLTGTPAPNGYEDLFNLYQFLYPFKYKDILGFHYGNLENMTKTESDGSARVNKFIENISPFFVRIKKEDLQLPETKNHPIRVPMDAQQREIYDFIETKYVSSFRKNSSAGIGDILNKAKLIRLRQASTNPSMLLRPIAEALDCDDNWIGTQPHFNMPEEYQDDSDILRKIREYSENGIPQKYRVLSELVSGNIISQKEKVIIWSIFVYNAKKLQEYLLRNGIESKLLIGEVDPPERESTVRQFNNPQNLDFQVVIANPLVVAESISLHKGCHNAIYLERDYNCSYFLQSKDRIHRIGLEPNQITNYYYFLSEDSIDETIHNCLEKKVDRMESVINAEIPLFARIDNEDETDVIEALIKEYAERT